MIKAYHQQFNSQQYIREIDDSLHRLNTDYVDIYQLHWPDPDTPIEETMAALERIKEAGKIRHVGGLNFSLNLTRQAMALGTVVSYQGLLQLAGRNADSYHNIPLTYRVKDEILPFCREKGLAFSPTVPCSRAFSPTASKPAITLIKMMSARRILSSTANCSNNTLKSRKKLRGLAREIHKRSAAGYQLVVKQEAVTSVIAGANSQQVEENVGSIAWELDR